jgi:GR25 family glycosyltransferase involved in LPS biosynthesis
MKIYVINLDRQPERLKSVDSELIKSGLTYQKISAVDMHDLTSESSDLVTLGVKACWQSHVKAFQLISQGDEPYALILEDDASILNLQKFGHLISNFEFCHWDLVQLGYISPGIYNRLQQTFKRLESALFNFLSNLVELSSAFEKRFGSRMRIIEAKKNPKGFISFDFMPGTHAYVVSKEMASILIGLNSPQFLSADDFFSALVRMRSFKSLRVCKSLITQKPFSGFPGDRFIIQ